MAWKPLCNSSLSRFRPMKMSLRHVQGFTGCIKKQTAMLQCWAMLASWGWPPTTKLLDTAWYSTLHKAEPKDSCNLSHIIDIMSSLQSQMLLHCFYTAQPGSARDLLIRSSPPQSFCGCPPKIMWMPDFDADSVLFRIFMDSISIRFMFPSLNMWIVYIYI